MLVVCNFIYLFFVSLQFFGISIHSSGLFVLILRIFNIRTKEIDDGSGLSVIKSRILHFFED